MVCGYRFHIEYSLSVFEGLLLLVELSYLGEGYEFCDIANGSFFCDYGLVFILDVSFVILCFVYYYCFISLFLILDHSFIGQRISFVCFFLRKSKSISLIFFLLLFFNRNFIGQRSGFVFCLFLGQISSLI